MKKKEEYLKKTGIIFGHILCVGILMFSFNESASSESKKEKQLEIEATEFPTPAPTIIPTVMPTPTVTPTATPTVTPTATPTPTVTPTATPIPTPTITRIITPEMTFVPEESSSENRDDVKEKVLQKITDGEYSALDNRSDNWWFRRKKEHIPSGSGEFFPISEYSGFYLDTQATEDDKVVYLTIDCGYGSSNTDVIMDTLKKHEVSATFFVTGYFLDSRPEQAIRMAEEGHTVANHSVTHANLTNLTDMEIYEEIVGCEEKYFEITGKQMSMFFRPPEGAYSKRTMQLTEDLGYTTVFWSIAYFDYDKKNQPGKQYVLDHFAEYHHNGAIPLMHNDSDSNMEAMDEVITFLKEKGYRFGNLSELKG